MNYSDVFLERLVRLVAARLTCPVSLGHLSRMDTDELRLVAAREAASPALTAPPPIHAINSQSTGDRQACPLVPHSASVAESKA